MAEYVIANPEAGKGVYLQKIENTKPKKEGGDMITAEYTTERKKAKRFSTLLEAEEYIRKHSVLRFCRIVRAEEPK